MRKELGYLKFILHKHINTSLQQGLARTRNSEGKSMQAINQNCYICIKKTAKNDAHVNIFALTICGLHISSFFFYTAVLSTIFADQLQLLRTSILVSICLLLVHNSLGMIFVQSYNFYDVTETFEFIGETVERSSDYILK